MAPTDRRRDWELESLLETVLVEGMVVASRWKMPPLLNRQRERGEIWQEIKDRYEEIGGDPDTLRGKRVGDRILLARFDLDEDPYNSAESEIICPQTGI